MEGGDSAPKDGAPGGKSSAGPRLHCMAGVLLRLVGVFCRWVCRDSGSAREQQRP